MQWFDRLILMARRNFLRLLNGLLGFHRHFFKSQHNVLTSLHYSKKEGQPYASPLCYPTAFCGSALSLSASDCRLCRSFHIDFDLLRLGFLSLLNAQRQYAVAVIGFDRFAVHGVRQREAACKRTIRALHAQIVFFVHLLLELALTTNRQDVVLDTNVELLWLDLRDVRLHHQFVLGLVNVDGRSPS